MSMAINVMLSAPPNNYRALTLYKLYIIHFLNLKKQICNLDTPVAPTKDFKLDG